MQWHAWHEGHTQGKGVEGELLFFHGKRPQLIAHALAIINQGINLIELLL